MTDADSIIIISSGKRIASDKERIARDVMTEAEATALLGGRNERERPSEAWSRRNAATMVAHWGPCDCGACTTMHSLLEQEEANVRVTAADGAHAYDMSDWRHHRRPSGCDVYSVRPRDVSD